MSEAREELRMLDALLAGGGDRWNEFFGDRARPCPFLVEWPDENLVAWFNEGLLTPGRVLELGCGHGRNATYLASLGCRVTDQQVYEQMSLGGGLGYSEDRLRALWDMAPFTVRVLRQMKKTAGLGPCFGADFLWALLAAKDGSARFSRCSP